MEGLSYEFCNLTGTINIILFLFSIHQIIKLREVGGYIFRDLIRNPQ